ncbi:hypothetical protein VNO80_26480 [Phaseolus coccineus]|uniref:Uncharacterized protein n=1 Tax=Phaseolus coccineus TaxID=3886 RepID=A0AAN9LIA0_PHACN
MGLNMMNLKIVLLGMLCIGLVVCSSGREMTEKNEQSDEGWLLCSIDHGNCPDNKACNQYCLSAPYPGGGSCVSNKCCCKA